ncbi:MAG TPA: 4'-phosphopantetheinyl transferase superfamily protein [Halioglobus sp.]
MTGLLASASSASDPGSGGHRTAVPALAEHQLHLWLCSRDRIASSDDFKRRVLSRYADVAPADWQFAANTQGKPVFAGAAHALDFNISHSGDWLACGVTAGTPIGVDLEYCDPARASMKLARRFYRQEEVDALQDCSSDQQNERFYDLWTLKEAAVKARGEALVPGLVARGFALTFPSDLTSVTGQIALTTPALASGEHYCLLDPLAGYRVAICWLSSTPLPPELRVFELCEDEESIAVHVPLRASTWPLREITDACH